MTSSKIYVGVNGNVLSLDRATGEALWCTELKGSDFVNLLVDCDRIIATTKGEVFCLDAATGEEIWHNKLPGQGWGLVSIATENGATAVAPNREKQRQEEQAAAGAA
jgi:outer membrane protein assembly factor BamB